MKTESFFILNFIFKKYNVKNKSGDILAYTITPDVLKKYACAQKNVSAKGVRVGIVTAYTNKNVARDLELFCRKFNIPYKAPLLRFTGDNNAPSALWYKETATALQYTIAFAHGCRQIVYSAGSDKIPDLLYAAKKASEECEIICLNFGAPEWDGQKIYSDFFKIPKKLFVCALGNNGVVNFPASSSDVLCVGGVNANFSEDGELVCEKVSNLSGAYYSIFEKSPPHQKSFLHGNISSRSVPDLCFFAYGKDGAQIFINGKKDYASGTSLASSCVAGICAAIRSYSDVILIKKSKFFYDLSQEFPQTFKKISPEKNNFSFGGLGVPNVYEILKNI